MNNKKTYLIILTIAVIGVVVFAFFNNSRPSPQPIEQEKAFDPRNPNFIMGNVVSASNEKIQFQSSAKDFTTQLSSQTKLVKQVKDGTAFKIVDATLADFKTNSKIVVYFSAPAENSIYIADKIQIISQ